MNEKREKQKEEEKVNKDRKMQSETIILRPEVPLLERLSTYAASDAYPFHMPGHKRQVKMGITSVPNPFSVDITEIDGFDNLHHAEDILKESMNSAAAVYGADRSWYLVNGSTCGILAAIAAAVKPVVTTLYLPDGMGCIWSSGRKLCYKEWCSSENFYSEQYC